MTTEANSDERLERAEVREILRSITPLRALEPARLERLLDQSHLLTLTSGQWLTRQGERDCRVFVLLRGLIEVWNAAVVPPQRLETIEPGRCFGERAVLLDEPRDRDHRASDRGPAHLLVIAGEVYLELTAQSPAFAQALGSLWRLKRGGSDPIDNFLAELRYGVSQGMIPLFRLIPRYLQLQPALHPLANDEGRIDWPALLYAVRRLPDTITRTFMLFLADEVPALYGQPQRLFQAVATATRPRATYEMLPGKAMVLLRDGLSDLLDLICCICLYAVESRKIRKRVATHERLILLGDHLEDRPNLGPTEADRRDRRVLAEMGFDERDIQGLRQIWPRDPCRHLQEMLVQHEDLAIGLRRRRDDATRRPAESWAAQIAADFRDLTGDDPHDLPPELAVHVISSNTHSVTNCLSHYLADHADRILAWGRAFRPELYQEEWSNPRDLLYALARDFLRTHPDEAARKRRLEREGGVLRRYETAFTGIQVELIDLAAVARRPVDPDLTLPDRAPAVIVNIDFAFGQQAEEILAVLILLFRRNLASVNILGKAGTLVGNRGDLLAPTAFLDQHTDQFQPLVGPQRVDFQRLRRRLPHHQLHQGPMLTVLGTLMQNRVLLNLYKNIWRCVGLEMEGFHYHNQLVRSIRRGVLSDDLAVRFLYYVSDAPLRPGESLSESLRVLEGVPPLYAVTREVLAGIFEQERQRAGQPLTPPPETPSPGWDGLETWTARSSR